MLRQTYIRLVIKLQIKGKDNTYRFRLQLRLEFHEQVTGKNSFSRCSLVKYNRCLQSNGTIDLHNILYVGFHLDVV